jgi:hypothetical protein
LRFIFLVLVPIFPYFTPLQPLVSFPQHRILHFRRRACRPAVAVCHRNAIDVPSEPSDSETEDDDQKKYPVRVGESLYLGGSLVDTCRFGEASPGIRPADTSRS